MKNNIVIALENIRSLHNVGAIIRSCEFFGINEIAFIGFTAYDAYSPDNINQKLHKTALSTLDKVKIKSYKTINELMEEYPTYELVCIDNNVPNTIDIKKAKISKDSIVLFGNEVEGVKAETLKIASKVIEIPRVGTHSSLNVATTVGIVIFSLTLDPNEPVE